MYKPWLQNPRFKAQLQQVQQLCFLQHQTATWLLWYNVNALDLQNKAIWLWQWSPPTRHKALQAEGVQEWCAYLRQHQTDFTKQSHLVLQLASAGADIHDPFASLLTIDELIEALLQLKQKQGVSISGWVQGSLGVYGGASLLLATVADTIYCDTVADVHLLSEQ